MQRDNRIDIIKGLAICLMVLGHCGCPATHFIYLFHMAVFFMASGYVYKQTYSESFSGLKKLFFKRLKSLWVPFILYKLIFSILWNPFVELNLYDGDLITPSFFAKIFLMNIFMIGSAPMCGAFWFLMSLFYITIAYAVVDWIFNRMKLIHKRKCHLIFALVVFLTIYIIEKKGFHSTTMAQILGPYMVYTVGVDLARNSNWMIDKLNLVTVFFGSFLVLIVCNDLGSISLVTGSFSTPYFFIVATMFGWFFIHSLALYIQGSYIFGKIFAYIGKNTLCIVGLHFLAFKFITLVQIKFYNLPIESLKSFPVLHVFGVWWIAYFLVGMSLPLMFNFVYKKTKDYILSSMRRTQKCI